MKVAYADESPQESHGIQKTKVFEIRTSAHAFKILSSGLYSDKISAVLREIGCNAHDAHIEARQTKPIEVKLPTRLNNQFYIKDWGIGLDDAEIEEMYTTYFASTKQTSNDFTGAFGLGSKSPFSYTDSFTVTAVKHGTKRVYAAHLNEQGSPTVSLLHTGAADPDWQNGVMVGFPVRPDDFEKFGSKAERIFRFFTPFPTIIGGKIPKPLTFTEDHGSYAFMDPESVMTMSGSNYYGRNGPNFLQMGNVVYPLTTSNLSFKNPNDLDVYISAAGTISGALIRVPIGSVQVAASREEIQYDDVTKETVAKILCEIPKKTVAKLIAEFRTKKTWEQLCEFKSRISSIHRSMSITGSMLKKTGTTQLEMEELESYMSYPGSIRWMKWDAVLKKAKIQHISMGRSIDFKLSLQSPQPNATRLFNPDLSTVILRGDDKNAYARARLAIKSKKYTNVILVTPFDGGDIVNVDGAIKELRKLVLTMPEVNVSTLDKPTHVKIAVARLNEKVSLDGTAVLLNDVPDDRKQFVQVKRRSNWGRPASTYIINGEDIRAWAIQNAIRNFEVCSYFLPKPERPIELNKGLIKRYKLVGDPAWTEYGAYMKEVLEAKTTLDALATYVRTQLNTINLDYDNGNRGIITSLTLLAHRFPKVFDQLRPTLKHHGILVDVEKLLKESLQARKGTSVATEHQVNKALEAFKELCELFGAKPKATPRQQVAADKFKHASKLEYDLLLELAKVSNDLLIEVVDFQLKKG